MNSPHANSRAIQAERRDLNVNSTVGDKKIYLVPKNSEERSVEWTLREQMMQVRNEVARLEALLLHKEQLLQNFRVREQELKASLFG